MGVDVYFLKSLVVAIGTSERFHSGTFKLFVPLQVSRMLIFPSAHVTVMLKFPFITYKKNQLIDRPSEALTGSRDSDKLFLL